MKTSDTYLVRDKAGKISLLFFSGIYFISTFGPRSWPLIIISGALAFTSCIFVLYNDYSFEHFDKIKWKVAGLFVALLYTGFVLAYSNLWLQS